MSCGCKRVLYKRVSEKPLQVKLLASEAEDFKFDFQNQWPIVSLLLDLYIHWGIHMPVCMGAHTYVGSQQSTCLVLLIFNGKVNVGY